MYADIYSVIVARLAALSVSNVDTALGDPPALPAVQPYLVQDKEIATKPTVIRELVYGVKVTVGHNDTGGAAQLEMLALLDTIRDGFAGWRPDDCVGIQGAFSVPDVRIEDFKDHGSTVYLVVLKLRVSPQTFNRT